MAKTKQDLKGRTQESGIPVSKEVMGLVQGYHSVNGGDIKLSALIYRDCLKCRKQYKSFLKFCYL